MLQLFVDREKELRFLEEHYASNSAELIVIYGRRRVGKTELCLRFSKGKPCIYFLADRRPEAELLRELKLRMSSFLQDVSFAKLEVRDWAELLQEFWKWKKRGRVTIILDEFPVLIEGDRAVPSIFQRAWDLNLKDKDVMLILLGSSVGMMETEVLDYRSPLYGRRTGQWKLEPLRFIHLRPFFPDYTCEDLVRVYGCIGGVPTYLLKFDPRKSFWKNCEQRILKKGEFLYQETEFLLREELREPRNYSSILNAIASGAQSYGEILNLTGLDKSILSKYVDVLENLGLVKKMHPVGFRVKPRKGLYRIADNYFMFWFRYVFTHKVELEAGNSEYVLKKIQQDYDNYLGLTFEDMATELLTEMRKRALLPFSFKTIGRWWFKDKEIDIIALDEEERHAIFLEVKWSDLSPSDCRKLLRDLEGKASMFTWERRRENLGLIAKKIRNKADLRREGYHAFDLNDFNALMREIPVP